MFKTKELCEEMEGIVLKTHKKLTKGKYAIAILDGVSFKSFTKYMKLPFDLILKTAMEKTMLDLCRRIDGCFLGFTQSDEICIVFKEARCGSFWNEGEVFKLTSYLAANAALLFNKYFEEAFYDFKYQDDKDYTYVEKDLNIYREKFGKAYFNVNIIQINKKNLNNFLIYKQSIAFRNSVQNSGMAHFSHKETEGKTLSTVIAMLRKKGVNYYNHPLKYRIGCMCTKSRILLDDKGVYSKPKWRIIEPVEFKEHPEFILDVISNYDNNYPQLEV